MKDCTFIDPRGDSYNYDMFFVQARNIRFVHIPPKVSNFKLCALLYCNTFNTF